MLGWSAQRKCVCMPSTVGGSESQGDGHHPVSKMWPQMSFTLYWQKGALPAF